MPRHLLPAFCLLLLLLCGACGPGYAEDDAWVKNVPLFAPGGTKVSEKAGDEDPKRDVGSFVFPSLVAGNGVMVSLAEAQYTDGDGKRVDIVVRYIETEGPNWEDEITENNGNNLGSKKIFFAHYLNKFVWRSPTAVIKGDKMYLFALHKKGPDGSMVYGCWQLELSVGKIMGGPGNRKIEWGSSESLHFRLMRELERKDLRVFASGCTSALLTSKGPIVFSVGAANKENESGFAIMELKDVEEQWEVSFVGNPRRCQLHSFLEWKERLISIITGCRDDDHYVNEYDEVSKEWKDFNGTLWRLGQKLSNTRGFTTASIGQTTVLLFTAAYTSVTAADGQWEIRLWVTDGRRFHDAGVIATHKNEMVSWGLLYTNGELFSLYQRTEKGSRPIVFKRLHHQLKEIKSVLGTWAEVDAYLSKPCNETALKGASSGTFCVTPVPVDGLVGFLSDKGDASLWHDKYRFLNAWVKGETRVDNGFTFGGDDSGARWLVGRLSLKKWYDFTKHGLTVVATVTIHETPKVNTPLLTVDGFGVKKRLGLWYKDKQWKVVSTNGKEEPAVDLAIQKEYRVALVLQNNTISVYVNGKSQGNLLLISKPGEELFDIRDIFIGGYGCGSGIHMTVTNVLLYSRVLNDTEFEAASKRIAISTSDVSGMTLSI